MSKVLFEHVEYRIYSASASGQLFEYRIYSESASGQLLEYRIYQNVYNVYRMTFFQVLDLKLSLHIPSGCNPNQPDQQ